MASGTKKTTSKAAPKDVQASPAFTPMRGEPNTAYGFTLTDGTAREIKSDAKGVVHPQRSEDVAFLTAHGLEPVKITESESGKTTIRKLRETSDDPPTAAVVNTGSSESDAERQKAAEEDAAKERADAEAAANAADAEKES